MFPTVINDKDLNQLSKEITDTIKEIIDSI